MEAESKSLSVWPSLIDMISSVLIIFILYSFLDQVINPKNLELILITKKRDSFQEAFESQFNSELRDSTITTRNGLDYVQITFRDGVLFQKARATMGNEARLILSKCSRLITETQDRLDIGLIQIEGHTDSQPIRQRSGTTWDNWDLSSARALAVLKYLESENIPSARLSASGYGANRPLLPNTTAKGMAANRRVEMKIYFSGFDNQ